MSRLTSPVGYIDASARYDHEASHSDGRACYRSFVNPHSIIAQDIELLARNAREAGTILEKQFHQAVISNVSLKKLYCYSISPTRSIAITTKDHCGVFRIRTGYEDLRKPDSPRTKNAKPDCLDTASQTFRIALLFGLAPNDIPQYCHVSFRRHIPSYVYDCLVRFLVASHFVQRI